MKKNIFFLILFILTLTFSLSNIAKATCQSKIINPLTDICWHCVFPVTIGGVKLFGTNIDTPTDTIKNPVCICGNKQIGLTVSFWEPLRMVETQKDPYCFNVIGAQLSNPKEGFLGGSTDSKVEHPGTFAQSHWYQFPLWAALGIFLDSSCFDHSGIDLAYITEIDPTWSDCLLAFILNPEAILFGNPITQIACVADSIAATISTPISPLFWCVGSWGNAYPLCGHTVNDKNVEANAHLAAKMIYKLSREGILWETGLNECGPIIMPIWVKENYRIHMAQPRRDYTCHPLGRSGLLWAAGKNPTTGGDNFSWMIFKKRVCCSNFTGMLDW